MQEEPEQHVFEAKISCLPSVIEDALQDNEIRTFETLPFSRFSFLLNLGKANRKLGIFSIMCFIVVNQGPGRDNPVWINRFMTAIIMGFNMLEVNGF